MTVTVIDPYDDGPLALTAPLPAPSGRPGNRYFQVIGPG